MLLSRMTNYTTRDAESVRLLPLTFAERTRRVAKRHAELAALRLLDAAVLRKWEYPLVESMHNGVNVECEGDLLVKDVHKALAHLDNNGYERSAHQRLFHRAFMMASLEQFYRGDLQRNLVRLLSDFGVSELHSEVAIMTPRRFGKTWGVAMWAASMLVMGRDHDTCIYSTGSRVSKMMLQTIMRMVRVLAAKFGGNIVSINKNEECVFETAAGYTNSIHAYPAKSDTLRGTGSKRRTGTVILEEAAFIAPDVSLSIVAPTLTRKYVNLFAISTINKDDMVMSSFMTATYPDGRAVMLSLNFALVCSACRESGRADTCQHMLGDLPHWSSTQQHQKLAALMRQSQETLQREIRGVDISENVRPAFNAAAIGALNDAVMGTLRAPLRTQSHVFVTIDPACGGSNSAMALVSFVFVDNMAVIVGAEECKSKSSEARQALIYQHVVTIQRREEFLGARIVVCIEANLGAEAQHYGNYLRARNIRNMVIMKEDGEFDGWRTTNLTKKAGYLRCNEILNERRLKFYEHMHTIEGSAAEGVSLRERIVRQLRSFMRIVEPQSKVWLQSKEIYTGKLSGDSDDLAMVVQMALITYERYKMRRSEYEGN